MNFFSRWIAAGPIPLSLAIGSGALVVAMAFSGCATTPPGATDANLALAKNRVVQGANAFEQHCSACHGERGEGLSKGPSVIGANALPLYPKSGPGSNLTTDPVQLQLRTASPVPGAPKRQPFNTAEDVFNYVSATMPPGNAGSLRPDEYWAIIGFMLVAHGAEVPEAGVTRENAAQIRVQVD